MAWRAAWGNLVTARLDYSSLERAGGDREGGHTASLGPQHVTGNAPGCARSLVAPKLLLSPSQSQAQRRVRSVGIGCTARGGTGFLPELPVADSVYSHLGKLQLGKFECMNVFHVCLLNHSKYLGLCSLGLLKSAGGSVVVCMHGRGSRGVGQPAPTVTDDGSVG